MTTRRRAPEHVPPPETKPLEGLSGMGARIGKVAEDKDQIGHVERQGLRPEEQQQIEQALDAEEAAMSWPEEEGQEAEGREPAPERSTEPHEDKGVTR